MDEKTSIKKILTNTNLQVGLLDDDNKVSFTRIMAWYRGIFAALFGKLWVKEFRTIIQGKKLISQQKSSK